MGGKERKERDRTIAYDFFFNPDQSLLQLADRYDISIHCVSSVISKSFKTVYKDEKQKIIYRRRFSKL